MKFAFIHTQSEEWRGLVVSVFFDEENSEINTQRGEIFDTIVDSFAYLE